MEYFFLTLIVLFVSLQNMTSKECTRKHTDTNVFIYTGISAFFALVFFVINSKFKLDFNLKVLPYAIGFGISYAATLVGNVYAIKTGPLSITALVLSYSLIIPTLYGIMFLGNKLTVFSYIGIAFLFISLYMINIKKDEQMKFSFIWVIFVLLSFVGNGMCSTFQTMQQRAFDGLYKNELMIAALSIVVVMLFVFGFVKAKREENKCVIKHCIPYAPIQGIANGFANYFVMVLTNKLAPAIMFPTISAGGIVCTFIVSLGLYKEKLSAMQLIGYAFGVLSVILLNL